MKSLNPEDRKMNAKNKTETKILIWGLEEEQ